MGTGSLTHDKSHSRARENTSFLQRKEIPLTE